MEKITIKASRNFVKIIIPVDLLKHAAENSESLEGCKITNKVDFANEVAKQIDGVFSDAETGLTKFEMFLDEVFEEVLESGAECIDMGDEDE